MRPRSALVPNGLRIRPTLPAPRLTWAPPPSRRHTAHPAKRITCVGGAARRCTWPAFQRCVLGRRAPTASASRPTGPIRRTTSSRQIGAARPRDQRRKPSRCARVEGNVCSASTLRTAFRTSGKGQRLRPGRRNATARPRNDHTRGTVAEKQAAAWRVVFCAISATRRASHYLARLASFPVPDIRRPRVALSCLRAPRVGTWTSTTTPCCLMRLAACVADRAHCLRTGRCVGCACAVVDMLAPQRKCCSWLRFGQI